MVSVLAYHLPQRFVRIILAGAVNITIPFLKFGITNRTCQFLFDHCFCIRKAFAQACEGCTTSCAHIIILIKQALQ